MQLESVPLDCEQQELRGEKAVAVLLSSPRHSTAFVGRKGMLDQGWRRLPYHRLGRRSWRQRKKGSQSAWQLEGWEAGCCPGPAEESGGME